MIRSGTTAAHAVGVLSASFADTWMRGCSRMRVAAGLERRRTETLVRRASGGDQAAFESDARGRGPAAGDRPQDPPRPGCREDAVQQAVILAWRLLPRLRDPERFDGWLYKILVSCSYSEAKRSRVVARVEDLTLEPAAGDEADERAQRELIEQAFQALTPPHRAIVVLHYFVASR